MTTTYVQDNAAAFKYLFRLQKSGVTNMFGAAPYLQRTLSLEKNVARELLCYWMENYDPIAKELGVEV